MKTFSRTLMCIAIIMSFSINILSAQEEGQSEIQEPDFVTNPPEHTEEKVYAIGTSKNTSEDRAQVGAEGDGRQALVDTLRAQFNAWADSFAEEIGDSTQTAYQMEEAVSGFYVQEFENVEHEEKFIAPNPDIPQIIHVYLLLSYPADKVKNMFLEYLGRNPELYNAFIESDTFIEMAE